MIARATIVVGLMAALCAPLAPVHASPSTLPRPAALARLCVSEAGWNMDVGDCPAIYAAIKNRAAVRGISWTAQARAYSGRVYDRTRTGRRRWIAWLSPTLDRPRGWPDAAVRWERGAELWRARLEEAAKIIAGELAAPCADTVEHWGCRYGVDLRRARRALAEGRWSVAECGETLNTFYAVRRAQ